MSQEQNKVNEEEFNKHIGVLLDRLQTVINGYVSEHGLDEKFDHQEINHFYFHILSHLVAGFPLMRVLYEEGQMTLINKLLKDIKTEVLEILENSDEEEEDGPEREPEKSLA